MNSFPVSKRLFTLNAWSRRRFPLVSSCFSLRGTFALLCLLYSHGVDCLEILGDLSPLSGAGFKILCYSVARTVNITRIHNAGRFFLHLHGHTLISTLCSYGSQRGSANVISLCHKVA